VELPCCIFDYLFPLDTSENIKKERDKWIFSGELYCFPNNIHVQIKIMCSCPFCFGKIIMHVAFSSISIIYFRAEHLLI
jgi:hypothetical protein